jgi:hypothetical protein
MPRRPSPDAESYLRLILGISMNKRILSIDEQSRLSFALALLKFVSTGIAGKPAMSIFIKKYGTENKVSRSFCYKVKARLEKLTIIKWDDYWQEYRYNSERLKRDQKALRQFKAQIRAWNKI